jgi:uncharacterized membrane protein
LAVVYLAFVGAAQIATEARHSPELAVLGEAVVAGLVLTEWWLRRREPINAEGADMAHERTGR